MKRMVACSSKLNDGSRYLHALPLRDDDIHRGNYLRQFGLDQRQGDTVFRTARDVAIKHDGRHVSWQLRHAPLEPMPNGRTFAAIVSGHFPIGAVIASVTLTRKFTKVRAFKMKFKQKSNRKLKKPKVGKTIYKGALNKNRVKGILENGM